MSSLVSIQKVADHASTAPDWAVAAGYLGALLGVLMVAPQIGRTLRDRHRPGVSQLSWTLTALSCLTWLLYGVRASEPPQIPGNVIMVTGSALIVLAVPSAVSALVRGGILGVSASVLIGAAFVLPAPAIGFIAFGIGMVAALPQLVVSMTGRRREASGVSILSWLLRAASQVSWLIYALALHDVVVSISASFIMASALLLVVAERRSPVSSTARALDDRCVENVEAVV